MSTIRLSHALIGTFLLAASALSMQVQARPSNPFWRPGVSVVPLTTEKPCGPIVKPAWYGPRGGGVVTGDHGPCPKPPQVVDRWVGPRGTVPFYR